MLLRKTRLNGINNLGLLFWPYLVRSIVWYLPYSCCISTPRATAMVATTTMPRLKCIAVWYQPLEYLCFSLIALWPMYISKPWWSISNLCTMMRANAKSSNGCKFYFLFSWSCEVYQRTSLGLAASSYTCYKETDWTSRSRLSQPISIICYLQMCCIYFKMLFPRSLGWWYYMLTTISEQIQKRCTMR